MLRVTIKKLLDRHNYCWGHARTHFVDHTPYYMWEKGPIGADIGIEQYCCFTASSFQRA